MNDKDGDDTRLKWSVDEFCICIRMKRTGQLIYTCLQVMGRSDKMRLLRIQLTDSASTRGGLVVVSLLCCFPFPHFLPVAALHPAAGYIVHTTSVAHPNPHNSFPQHHNLKQFFITQPPATSHERVLRNVRIAIPYLYSDRLVVLVNHVWWVSFFLWCSRVVVPKVPVIIVHPARSSLHLESIPKGTRRPFPCMSPLKAWGKQMTFLSRFYFCFPL